MRLRSWLVGFVVAACVVPFVGETTFYTRHGNVFAQACAAMALALVAATFRRSSTKMEGRRHS